MCIPYRLFSLVLAAALTGCGGDLTLPGEGSPTSPTAILRVESGDGQQGTVGKRLDDPLVVKLIDASSQPIAGIPVVFQFKNEVPDAEVDPVAMTGRDGLASAEVRLGTSTGPYQIEARVSAPVPLSTTFVVTALERRGGGGGHDGD